MSARAQLVSALRARGAIRSDVVAAAFAAVPRELFIPDVLAREGLSAVYRDEAFVTKRHPQGMPISSSSQPALMADMLELLDVRPGHRVLEIGAGTGYNAALLRQLVGPLGQVSTIDVDPELARTARAALRQAGVRARVLTGDGRAGAPSGGPYDRIVVTACADEIPRAWLDQLLEGGRIVLPLRLDPDGAAIQLIPVLARMCGRLRSDGMTWGGFMALHGGDGGWRPPPEQLTATRSDRGVPTQLVALSGGGLARLPEAVARGRLAELLTGAGERRGEGRTAMGGGRAPLLLVYLLLGIPARSRVSVSAPGRLGVGLIDRATGSLAVFTVPSPWSRPAGDPGTPVEWRLDAYGGGTAADRLGRLLERWQELETAGPPGLELTALARPGAGALRLRFRWG